MSKQIFDGKFIMGVEKAEQFPAHAFPEIAFAGRSNVGKSSLINSIVLRKKLAHISSTPGKTQQINFFLIDERWMLVDMPGFGYAKVGKEKRKSFSELNHSYLDGRQNLKFVCCLIDSRHDPMEQDLALIEWLENHEIEYLMIMTKCDKIKPGAIIERKKQLEHLVSICNFAIEVLPYSAETGLGRNELIGIIKKYCG